MYIYSHGRQTKSGFGLVLSCKEMRNNGKGEQPKDFQQKGAVLKIGTQEKNNGVSIKADQAESLEQNEGRTQGHTVLVHTSGKTHT